MSCRKLLAAGVLALGTLLGTGVGAAPTRYEVGPELVTNGGFESGNFSGWNASFDPTLSGVDGVAAHSGSFGAYFGEIGTPGTLVQSLATLPGSYYNIHLWLRSDGQRPNSFDVLWGGRSVYSVLDVAASAFTEIVLDPQASSALTTLELRLRNDSGFFEIDDISVRQLPEPITLALVGPGLFGLALARRRKVGEAKPAAA
ncbi:hypothetical protein [Piscinibacter koreensis]|uniref:PEP-CTERM protein-sorting domain-containing protein n=1 Tax=Piscinibacter koreensis TaxID=2742824 RepID=A0A7Y6NL97_9BURK|nr:hypothetical protein [Schlegelella koreensis]NUZ05288.1 hypothetical protein [Schlegelella koreensis]